MKQKSLQTNNTKENLIATLRAIASDESVQVEFEEEVKNNFFSWNQNLVSAEKKVCLPEIIISKKYQDVVDFSFNSSINLPFRASADMAACYLLFHDKKINAAHRQAQDEISIDEQIFFDEFEKIRVIACIKNSYQGAVKNILRKVEDDIFNNSTSLSLVLLKEIFGAKVLSKTASAVKDLEKNLSPKVITEIKNLAKKTDNQSEFYSSVARLLELLKSEENSQDEQKNEGENQQNQKSENADKNNLENFGAENIAAENLENFPQNGEEESEQQTEKESKIAEFKEDDSKGEASIKLDKTSPDENKIEFKNAYKVFTSKFDEVIFPQKLVAKNELEILRDQLDLRIAKLSGISKKMTLKLKRKLLSKRNSFLEFDASGGILDRKKLTRLVIDPMLEKVWVNNKNHEYHNTALTILLDNSGSMRGNPIVMSALACQIIAEILEKFSVKTEIIGFTTSDWKGGKVRKLWESSGQPRNPGRLNQLRHIIYKHFNQSFKQSKINLGLMLKEGVLKENIDGEALLFARSRLMQQSEKRKILIVISDGTPVDDSTALANDSDILSDHLHHVINKIERQSKIEIVGIGIGHSTEEFYRNFITIRSAEELGDVMIEKITSLL